MPKQSNEGEEPGLKKRKQEPLSVKTADKKPPIVSRLITGVSGYIKSQDTFGVGAPPFNFGGKGKANSFPGGLVSSFIKVLSLIFLALKLNEMIFFSSPLVQQLTL